MVRLEGRDMRLLTRFNQGVNPVLGVFRGVLNGLRRGVMVRCLGGLG